MDWIKLAITTTNEASEAVINILMENGAHGKMLNETLRKSFSPQDT